MRVNIIKKTIAKKTGAVVQNAIAVKGLLSLLIVSNLMMTSQVQAAPFATLDARSAAMGGVGVATQARNAAYYNPALLAADYENFDAVGLFPVHSELTNDPDNVESGLNRLKVAAKNSADISAIQAALTNLADKTYNETTINSAAIIVPSTTLGAAGFVNSYKYTSAKTNIGGDVFGNPITYNSTLEHRSLDFIEIGAGVGKLLDQNDSLFSSLQLGFMAKILLFESYGYTTPIDSASLAPNSKQIRRDSMINFDLGLAKEIGVWKMGLVVRNIISADVKYGVSDEIFSIGPQVRMGLAYQSRRTLVELDVDVTSNEGFGFAKETAYVAAGLEFRLLPRLYLRSGVRQNRVGDALTTGSLGIGLDFWGVMLDVAGQSNKDEQAVLINIASSF